MIPNKPRKIEESGNFWQFIQRPSKQLFDALNGLESAIDVGFQDGLPLWVLYHQYNYSRLLGIDKNSQYVITEDYRKNKNPTAQNIFDYYHKEFRVPKSFPNNKIKSEQKFYNIFEYKTISMERYFSKPLHEKFDLIILSNILHYAKSQKSVEKILENVLTGMNSDSMIYIRVKSKNWMTINLSTWEGLIKNTFSSFSVRKIINNVTHEGESLTFTNLPNN